LISATSEAFRGARNVQRRNLLGAAEGSFDRAAAFNSTVGVSAVVETTIILTAREE
jgi:hypothetical protein